MTTDEAIREEDDVRVDEDDAEFEETVDDAPGNDVSDGAIEGLTGSSLPSAGLIVGSVAVSSVLAFAAGTLVTGEAVGALPFVAVAVIVAVIPGAALAYVLKRWVASLSAKNEAWIQTALETSCDRFGTLFDASLARSEDMERRLAKMRTEAVGELQQPLQATKSLSTGRLRQTSRKYASFSSRFSKSTCTELTASSATGRPSCKNWPPIATRRTQRPNGKPRILPRP